MTTAFRVPERLARTVVAAFGDVGREWLAELPRLVAEAASVWQLDLGGGRIASWTFACCVELTLECCSVGDAHGFRRCVDRTEQLLSQHLV